MDSGSIRERSAAAGGPGRLRSFAATAALFLLLGVLPALLARTGATLYLDDAERARVEERLDGMRRAVETLAEEVRGDWPKQELLREVTRALAALPDLTAAAVDGVAAEFERRHPGLLAITVHDFPDRDDPPGRGGIYRFRALGGERQEFRYLRNQLVSFLYHRWRMGANFADGTEEARLQRILRPLTGTRTRIGAIAFGRSAPHAADTKGRETWLGWDLIGRIVDGAHEQQDNFRAVALVLADEEAYRREFSEARLVERANGSFDGRFRAGILDLEGTALPAELAGLSRETVRAAALSGATLERGRTLAVFAPLAKEAGRYLYAAVPRAAVDPGRARAERRIDRLLLLALALLLALLLLDRARIIHPAVPMRAQLAAFLLLAALPPLAALFHFGFEHMRALRVIVTADEARRVLARVADLDGALVAQFAEFRSLGLAFRDRLNAGEAVEAVHADLNRMLRFGGTQDERIDEYFLFSRSGDVLLKKENKRRDEVLLSALAAVAVNMVQHENRKIGVRVEEVRIDRRNMIEHVAGFLSGGGFTESIIKNRERLHRLSLLTTHACVMLEPIRAPDGDGFDRAFAITFDLKVMQRDLVKRFVRETHDSGAAVRLYAGSATEPDKLYPGGERFDEGKSRFLNRLMRERAEAHEFLAGSGETLLAAGRMLREANDFAVFGVVPQETVTGRVEARLALLRWAFLLTILAALGTAVAITRRVVAPLSRLESGVAAVAAGDYAARVDHASRDEFGTLARAFNGMVEGLEEKERMSRYVSDFVRSGVKGGEAPAAEAVRATILFSDIRDFTTLAETHGASAIVAMLNGYFDRMSAVVRGNGGVVDKFIGDALMAVFRLDSPLAERSALCCALEMRRELARFNAERAKAGLFEIETGVGLSTGTVILGDIGSAERLDRTVIGDQVNLAARLESLSREGRHTKVIVDAETLDAAAGLIDSVPLGERTVKGKSRAVEVAEIRGVASAEAFAPLAASSDPRDRALAVRFIRLATAGDRAGLVAPLLADPDPAVRAEAARGLRPI